MVLVLMLVFLLVPSIDVINIVDSSLLNDDGDKPYCCLKIRLKWVGFLSDKVHALYLIWLLAVVSLPCTFGDSHIGEYGCKG